MPLLLRSRKLHSLLLGLALLAASASLSACHSDELPKGIMSEDQLVDFLTDAYLTESYYAIKTSYRTETERVAASNAFDHLLQQYGISEEEFRASMDYYMFHYSQNQRIHKRVKDRIEEKVQSLDK